MSDSQLMTFAVAFYVGHALSTFFNSFMKDLVTPVIAGVFPGAEKTIDKIVVTIGGVKLNIGDVIGAFLNLMIALLVVSYTLPLIRGYSPLRGGKL